MFAKDSVLDLASLAKKSSSSISDIRNEGESSEVKVISSGDSDQDLSSLDKQESSSDTQADPSLCLDTEETTPDKPARSSLPYNTQYSGFNAERYSNYYDEGITYDYDPDAPTVFGSHRGEGGGNIWCCLIAPWFSNKNDVLDEDGESSVGTNGSLKRALSGDEDEVSTTGSEAYGEKLTDKHRMAVLARLRLPQTDPPLSAPAPDPSKKGLLEDIPSYGGKDQTQTNGHSVEDTRVITDGNQTRGKLKGILKRRGSSFSRTKTETRSPSTGNGHTTPRRSLFPSVGGTQSPTASKHVKFSPMARVVAIKSRKEMTFLEKSWIWWQKSDYDSFKKAGRIIAKAMLEGGSEVWLTTSPSLGSVSSRSKARGRSYHLSDRDPDLRSHEAGKQVSVDDYGDKWWCTFGHSRRGLEHIASMEEGRQRQMNVRASIRATLDEQRKQRTYGKDDPEKIRSVSLRQTSWAKDLSLAAGSADAEAVKQEFSSDARSREYYLLKQARANNGAGRQVPSFMRGGGTSLMLDANTSSQMRMRRKQVAPQPVSQPVKKPVVKVETLEAIHDSVESRVNLSRKAAGFGTDEADMAAVLSGMGAVSKEREMSAHPPQARVGAH